MPPCHSPSVRFEESVAFALMFVTAFSHARSFFSGRATSGLARPPASGRAGRQSRLASDLPPASAAGSLRSVESRAPSARRTRAMRSLLSAGSACSPDERARRAGLLSAAGPGAQIVVDQVARGAEDERRQPFRLTQLPGRSARTTASITSCARSRAASGSRVRASTINATRRRKGERALPLQKVRGCGCAQQGCSAAGQSVARQTCPPLPRVVTSRHTAFPETVAGKRDSTPARHP